MEDIRYSLTLDLLEEEEKLDDH